MFDQNENYITVDPEFIKTVNITLSHHFSVPGNYVYGAKKIYILDRLMKKRLLEKRKKILLHAGYGGIRIFSKDPIGIKKT